MIAGHIGVSSSTVGRYRVKFCDERSIPLPDKIETADGQARIYKRLVGRPRNTSIIGGNPQFRASFNGKEHYLSSDPNVAKDRANEIAESIRAKNARLEHVNFLSWLRRRMNVEAVSSQGRVPGIKGIKIRGAILVPCLIGSVPSLVEAVGAVLITRQYVDRTAEMVIVCYPEDGPTSTMELARQIGVKFMTPQQVVDKFQ